MPKFGYKLTEEHKRKLSESHKGKKWSEERRSRRKENPVRYWLGKKRPDISIMMMERGKNKPSRYWLGKKRPNMTGNKNWKWIEDRSLLKKQNRRNDPSYKEWRRLVWLRDNFVCKIANPDCEGRIEAHHILPWAQFDNLRYDINNGITLCHFHHPRKRTDESRLASFFQQLLVNET